MKKQRSKTKNNIPGFGVGGCGVGFGVGGGGRQHTMLPEQRPVFSVDLHAALDIHAAALPYFCLHRSTGGGGGTTVSPGLGIPF